MQKIGHSKDGLYRYQTNAQWGGVLAGLADKWDLSLKGVRIVFVLAMIFFTFISMGIGLFIGLALYFTLWAILPVRGEPKQLPDWKQTN